MAHVGRPWPFVAHRDYYEQISNFKSPPTQWRFNTPNFAGVDSAFWASSSGWSGEGFANTTDSCLEWVWENIPGSSNRTKFRVRYYPDGFSGNRLHRWKFAACLDGNWGSETLATTIEGFIFGHFVVANVPTTLVVVGMEFFRVDSLRIDYRNWTDF